MTNTKSSAEFLAHGDTCPVPSHLTTSLSLLRKPPPAWVGVPTLPSLTKAKVVDM